MSAAIDLSIVIVSYNARADLERCLASVHRHAPRATHEIIVVDNQSADGSAAAVRAGWPQVTVLDAGANLGFARATNVGIRAASGTFLLLLNSDTIVPATAIDTLTAILRARPDVAVVGPRLVNGEGVAELSFGRMIGPWQELRQKLLVRLHDRGVGMVSRHVERLTHREQTTDWVSGAALLVRRSEAEAVGLLDERFFMYAEDVDFCAAIRKRGGRVMFTPSAEIVHLRGRSVATAPAATARAYRRSQIAFYEKHHPAWVPVLRAYLYVTGKPHPTDGLMP